ncbi:response regulator transcription factor [Larkinella sp. VNQ87]|uniref:response regulator transcription factor n=1 Tax=Larkinella sp. VNQ87 TaxID=3400921 RepID=UPI003C0D2A6E
MTAEQSIIFQSETDFMKRITSVLSDLTGQERKVLRLTISDFSCKEIAEQLHISNETVKKHRKNIMRKFQVTGKVAFRRFLRQLEYYFAQYSFLYPQLFPQITPTGVFP